MAPCLVVLKCRIVMQCQQSSMQWEYPKEVQGSTGYDPRETYPLNPLTFINHHEHPSRTSITNIHHEHPSRTWMMANINLWPMPRYDDVGPMRWASPGRREKSGRGWSSAWWFPIAGDIWSLDRLDIPDIPDMLENSRNRNSTVEQCLEADGWQVMDIVSNEEHVCK